MIRKHTDELLVIALLSAIICYVTGDNEQTNAYFIGRLFGFIELHLILTYTVQGANTLFRRNFSARDWLLTFCFAWSFVSFASLYSYFTH